MGAKTLVLKRRLSWGGDISKAERGAKGGHWGRGVKRLAVASFKHSL